MKGGHMLVLGAGKSSPYLLKQLAQRAPALGRTVRVLDIASAPHHLPEEVEFHQMADLFDEATEAHFVQAEVVVSMLPPQFHPEVARRCLHHGAHLVTASYASQALRAMHTEAQDKGLLFLAECGLDPGIDHMSAMRELDAIRAEGLAISNFESFTGGLVAPDCENNPWRYKVTWNPRNVVLAGKVLPTRFRHMGKYKFIPYPHLFRRTEPIEVEGLGLFEGYGNRDSISYIDLYGLGDCQTVYRGTLRRPGFCRAWNVFVHLGMTDDRFLVDHLSEMTWRDFTNHFLQYNPQLTLEDKLQQYLDLDDQTMQMLEWIGLFSHKAVGLAQGTPADVLQHLIEDKLAMEPGDRDMVVMHHQFIYGPSGTETTKYSQLVVEGENPTYTAMAKTVGLPMAAAAEHMVKGTFAATGVHLPLQAEFYTPILTQLEQEGITFREITKKTEAIQS